MNRINNTNAMCSKSVLCCYDGVLILNSVYSTIKLKVRVVNILVYVTKLLNFEVNIISL